MIAFPACVEKNLAGLKTRNLPVLDEQPDRGLHLGTYQRASTRLEVLSGDDGPVLRTTETGPLAELDPDPVSEYPMTPVGPDVYVVRRPGVKTWTPVIFYQLRTGERYVHFGSRATPKTL